PFRARYVFNGNRRRFPDPKWFFDKMNEMGINVIPNLKPGILKNHPYMPLFEQNSVFIKNPDGQGDYYGRWWGGEGRFFDFTSPAARSEEHTSELQSRFDLVCRLLLEKKK